MKKASIIHILVMFCTTVFAQNSESGDSHIIPCYTTEMEQALFEANPEAKVQAEIARAQYEEFYQTFKGLALPKSTDPIIIPVVFHIVHFNGTENISNEQVHSAIEAANADYSATNPVLSSVHANFQDIIGDVNFELRLAKKDPDGNCTNGIIRTLDSGTQDAGENLKTISPAWPRSMYLNVWVCANIASSGSGTTLGYAYLPWSVSGMEDADIDGIVMRSDYIGSIGTSNPGRTGTFAHEVGHWAGLLHTWGAGNSPGQAGNCNNDDIVDDTPNTIGTQGGCPLNQETCGSQDNIENIMEYTNCRKMFTQGQALRMNSTMSSFTAQRNLLGTQSNLIATGVLDPDVICEADFETQSEPVLCSGQSITYQDISFNGVDDRSWVFEGGDPATSSEANPEVTYNIPGTYAVTLTVSNPNGSETVVKSDYVTVLATGQNQLPFVEGFESFVSLDANDQNWTVINEDGDNVKWELTSSAGYQSEKSIRVRGRNNFSGLDREVLISPTFDLTGLTDNAVLQFRYAHARRSSSSDDRLRVWISRNCGENWSLRKNISISDLPTVPGAVAAEFLPSGPSEWSTVVIDNISSIFLTDEFRVQFEFESFQGNNIYIDNINIIDGLTVGQKEIEMLTDFNIFPNPTAGETTIAFTLIKSSDLTVDLLDLTGRRVKGLFSGNRPAGSNMEYFDTSSLAQGMYVVRIIADGQQITRRISVL